MILLFFFISTRPTKNAIITIINGNNKDLISSKCPHKEKEDFHRKYENLLYIRVRKNLNDF